MRTPRQKWNIEDIRKLKAMAGKHPLNEIAVELGRRPSTVKSKAQDLRIFLRVHRIHRFPTSNPGRGQT